MKLLGTWNGWNIVERRGRRALVNPLTGHAISMGAPIAGASDARRAQALEDCGDAVCEVCEERASTTTRMGLAVCAACAEGYDVDVAPSEQG